MPSGGKRPGAGRKHGTKNVRSRKHAAAALGRPIDAAIAIAASNAGIQPIEVIISVMRHAWEKADYKTAAAMADIALPYCSPRLAAATITHRDPLDELTVDELRRMIVAFEQAAGIVSPPKLEADDAEAVLIRCYEPSVRPCLCARSRLSGRSR